MNSSAADRAPTKRAGEPLAAQSVHSVRHSDRGNSNSLHAWRLEVVLEVVGDLRAKGGRRALLASERTLGGEQGP